MIIELVVKNYRSIKESQTFSLVKSNSSELEGNSFTTNTPSAPKLLNSAAIYGANAAGKSNFVSALAAMQSIVVDSARESRLGEKLKVVPFRLSESTIESPTEFEVVFIADNVKYQYGFSATQSKVIEEWLFAFPNGKPQRWFARAFDKEDNKYAWNFGSFLTGKKQLWKESTRANSLFLSTAVMLNSEQLKPVYNWFNKTLKMTDISGWNSSFTASLCLKPESKAEVLEFLRSADLDIEDIKVETKPFSSSHFPDDMPASVKEKILEELSGEELHEVKSIHKNDQGDLVSFDFEDESDGTIKLFAFAGPWIDSLKNGKVLFIDELHDSLHPSIVKYLVSLFHDKRVNKNNAQLVFTTHETSILDQKVFRRDQVWFCNKEKDQSTSLYSLTEFSPRKTIENLEKSYLSGRYGALPLIGKIGF